MARGAAENLVAEEQDALLTAAYSSVNPEARQVLADVGLVAGTIDQVAVAAARLGSLTEERLRGFLDLGLSPNTPYRFVTVQIPLLGHAAVSGQVDFVRSLIGRGADPNATATGDTTPLMMAAARERVDVVRVLIDSGAKIDATDARGRSALDWALTRGETSVSRLLWDLGAVATASPEPAPSPAVARPRPVPAAIEEALARLAPISPAFRQRTGCISCHNQSIPAMAMVAASEAGIRVEPAVAAHPHQVTLEVWQPTVGQNLVGRCVGGGFVPNTAYASTAMIESGRSRTATTDARLSCFASLQHADGSWTIRDVRPPLGGSALVFTALGVRALDRFAPPGLRSQMQERIDRAAAFIRRTEAADTQDAAFKLTGLVWTDGTVEEIAEQVDALLDLQREDGGWAQEPAMAPDAYATGQTLYALRLGGVSPDQAAYQAAAEYLLRTQREDGSWFVRSRGFPFQPYFDYGFPHGTNQFISAVATSWAVMALSAML